MSIPTSDIHTVEVSLRAQLAAEGSDSQKCVNVFHYRRTATAVDPNKTNIGVAFNTAVVTPLVALLHQDWVLESIGLRFIDDALDREASYIPAGPPAGAIATADAPDHLCVSMLIRTNLRGRNYRGAKRFGGIAKETIDGDVIAAAKVAAWAALAVTITNGFTDSDGNVWVPCVLSRELSVLATNPTVIQTADVAQILLNRNIGSMNSRKVKTVR